LPSKTVSLQNRDVAHVHSSSWRDTIRPQRDARQNLTCLMLEGHDEDSCQSTRSGLSPVWGHRSSQARQMTRASLLTTTDFFPSYKVHCDNLVPMEILCSLEPEQMIVFSTGFPLPEGQYVVASCHIHTPRSDANGTPQQVMINKTVRPTKVQIGTPAPRDTAGLLC
jgi:hypothetical protein